MTRLQHLALKTNELAATRTFYLERLELPGRFEAESGHLWVTFEDGFVLRFDRTDEVVDPAAVQYLGLELGSFEDVDRMHARLTRHVRIERDLRARYRDARGPYGFFVADPSGYLVKIFRYNAAVDEALDEAPDVDGSTLEER
jgi:extradiol dioxygenase family protein